MFGYTIVLKIYIERLKEELELLYDLNEKLDKETGELRLRAHKANQVVDTQLGRIAHLEQTIAALTCENEELKLQIKDFEAQVHDLERESRW